MSPLHDVEFETNQTQVSPPHTDLWFSGQSPGRPGGNMYIPLVSDGDDALVLCVIAGVCQAGPTDHANDASEDGSETAVAMGMHEDTTGPAQRTGPL